MEKILEGIERASTASSLAIQSFVGQGVIYRFFLNYFSLSWSQLSVCSPLFIGRKLGLKAAGFSAGFPELCH
jgi:hypothetical protein